MTDYALMSQQEKENLLVQRCNALPDVYEDFTYCELLMARQDGIDEVLEYLDAHPNAKTYDLTDIHLRHDGYYDEDYYGDDEPYYDEDEAGGNG